MKNYTCCHTEVLKIMVEVAAGQAKNERYGSVTLRRSREITYRMSGGCKSIQEMPLSRMVVQFRRRK